MTTNDTRAAFEALLPCPFCNSTDISLHSGLHIAHVECGGCGAQGPTVIIQAGQPARSAWNIRAALASPEVQALRKDADRLDFLITEECQIQSLSTPNEVRHRLYWPDTDEAQCEWSVNPRAAIDAAIRSTP